jgi:hypothetical protein
MADPREDEEILLNMIRGSAEEGRYDDRECDENPKGIDDMQPPMFIYMKFKKKFLY